MKNAAALGYDKLLENHEADYTELFDRVKLDIGAEVPENKTTDALLNTYKAAYESNTSASYNKYLETLYYQYGRYLLIASSRDNSFAGKSAGRME
nr:CAZy families CBM51/GH95 protein [uncultured Clostridium sp.]